MKKWFLLKNIPISRLDCKKHTLNLWPKSAKIDTLFMTKMAEKQVTLWGRTYLYNPYMIREYPWGVHPLEFSPVVYNLACINGDPYLSHFM